MEKDVEILDVPAIEFTELKEPEEGDTDHIEQHIKLVQQMRLVQLKIEWLLKAVKVLNDNFEKLDKMATWVKTAYDVAVYNLQTKFEEAVKTFTKNP